MRAHCVHCGNGRRRLGRRLLLRSALALSAAIAAAGHAPYGQWNIYRKRNLHILTSRSDAPTYPLGERVAKVLAAHLPESRARASRAPDVRRVASLLSSGQMDVAVLSRKDAAALSAGVDPFAEYGPVALRTLVSLGGYLLACREDFPPLHAYLVAEALVENSRELDIDVPTLDARKAGGDGEVPLHGGARAYFDGRPPPED